MHGGTWYRRKTLTHTRWDLVSGSETLYDAAYSFFSIQEVGYGPAEAHRRDGSLDEYHV